MFDASAVMHGYIHEGIAAVVLSVGGWVLVFPVRTFFGAIKEAWDTQVDTLKEIAASTDKQTELLGKVADTLSDMHLSQIEMTGFMKGSHHE